MLGLDVELLPLELLENQRVNIRLLFDPTEGPDRPLEFVRACFGALAGTFVVG